MTRLVLGNPPPLVLTKDLKGWITEATPIRGEFTFALRLHVTSLHCDTVDLSSDDASDGKDDFSPILLPPGFQPASVPPPGNVLVPLDSAGKQMIGQHILFKWPKHGWYLGKISSWNSNPNRTVCKQIFNFTFFYSDDSSSGSHCLSLDNYNIDADNDSPNHTWLMIEPSNPQPPSHRQLQRNAFFTNSGLVPTGPASGHLPPTAGKLPHESRLVVHQPQASHSQRSINSSISRPEEPPWFCYVAGSTGSLSG